MAPRQGGRGYGAAVENGALRYTSVSAINKFSGCQRAWYYKYVERLPDDPPGPAMQFGIEAHGRIEHYLKTGENVLGEIERAGWKYIPAPGDDLIIEGEVAAGVPLSSMGVPLNGGMDLADPRFLSSGGVRVTDWKFKSDPKRYGTTPERLVDPTDSDGRQMLGYAYWVVLNKARFPGIEWVQVRHIHFKTRGPPAAFEVLSEQIPLQEIAWGWEIVGEKFVAPMKLAAAAKSAEDVPYDENFCFAYHKPCPFIKTCPQGNVGDVGSLFNGSASTKPVQQEENAMSMIDRMKKLAAPGWVDATATATTPVAETKAETKAATKAEPKAKLTVDEALTVLGNDFAPEPVRETEPTPQIDLTKPEPAFDPLPPKRGPGRPKKVVADAPPAPTAKAEVRPHTITVTGYVTAEEPKVVSVITTTGPTTYPIDTVGGPIFKLYFGCSPVGVETRTLHSFMEALERQALKACAEKLPDVRMSEKDGLKYGKYKAVLSQLAKENPPAPGHYVVNYGDERIEAVASGLESIAAPGNVVRGGGR